VEELKKDTFLWTNEGNNFRAWIGDHKGTVLKRINVATAKSLERNGFIKFVDGDYPDRLYKYELVKI
jgi:hypothetical protein